MWLILTGAALAAPSAEVLRAAWEAQTAVMAANARFPVNLQAADFTRLSAGQSSRHREPTEGADRVVGALWTEIGRDALWIAILDDQHFDLVHGLVEEQLPGTGPLRKLLYQRLDLPWPLADRQWVIDIQSNTALAAASGGAAWERAWTLANPALARSPDPDAVWTTVNEGGWLLLPVAGGTLMIYQVRTDVGGAVPDAASAEWAWSTLDELLQTTVRRAAGLASHYTAQHAPIYRPDGSRVPPLGP